MSMARQEITLPESLLEAIDGVVGRSKRVRFIQQAVLEKLERARQAEAYEAAFGSLADVDVEGWETEESTRAWVSSLRNLDSLRESELSDE